MTRKSNAAVFIIAGPTASGKSALAVDIARQCNGVVINADSMQIYREIPVISAQPDATERKDIPHELYGFHSVTQHYSAADWALAAAGAIEKTFAENRRPILVGGSGLYLRALVEGFSPLPQVPPDTRRRIAALYDILGSEKFHAELAKIDPAIAARLHATDRQRCIRAREVYEATGEALSLWQQKPKTNIAPHVSFKTLLLFPDRKTLYERIDKRFEQMMHHGALEEAAAMNALHLDPMLTGAKAVGLQALRDHLHGKITDAQALEMGQTASRQYAKRQYTWFRNQPLPHSIAVSDGNDAAVAAHFT